MLELWWTLAHGFKVVVYADREKNHAAAAAPTKKVSRHKRPIDFSLFYFSSNEAEHGSNKYRLLLDGAKFGDENGFTGPDAATDISASGQVVGKSAGRAFFWQKGVMTDLGTLGGTVRAHVRAVQAS